jgi:hypothetical protein
VPPEISGHTRFSLVVCFGIAMTSAESSANRSGSRRLPEDEAHVVSLLESLNLTIDEGQFVALSDDEKEPAAVGEPMNGC